MVNTPIVGAPRAQRGECRGSPSKSPALLDVNSAILDGEVIAPDETGRPRFYDLLRPTRTPAYVAFDILWLDGADLRTLPLSERRQRLRGILPKRSVTVAEALSVVGRGCQLFELMCAHDLKGSSPSACTIGTTRASEGSRSRTRTTHCRKADASCPTDGGHRIRTGRAPQ
jgi:hypothetical protein